MNESLTPPEAVEITPKTFYRTENGFINVQGPIVIQEVKGKFKVVEIAPGHNTLHKYLVDNPDSVPVQGSENKEGVMHATEEILKELGNEVNE